MSEYIIDEKEYRNLLDYVHVDYCKTGAEAENATELQLAVSEKIVRCRDCKHYREITWNDGTKSSACSGVFTFVEARPDGFCAWGERHE